MRMKASVVRLVVLLAGPVAVLTASDQPVRFDGDHVTHQKVGAATPVSSRAPAVRATGSRRPAAPKAPAATGTPQGVFTVARIAVQGGTDPDQAPGTAATARSPLSVRQQPARTMGATNATPVLAMRTGGSDQAAVEESEHLLTEATVEYRVRIAAATPARVKLLQRRGLADAARGTKDYVVGEDVYQELRAAGLRMRVLGGTNTFRVPLEGLAAQVGAASTPAIGLSDQVESTGTLNLSSGTQNLLVPDAGFRWLGLRAGTPTAPAGATTTGFAYQVRIHNDTGTNGGMYCGDYEIYLSSAASGGSVPHLLVYNHLGTLSDGGYDDDTEDDRDIYLNYRTTTHFNGEDPNQWWYLYVSDTWGGNEGYIGYVNFRVSWTAPDPDLRVSTFTVPSTSVTEGSAYWVRANVNNAGAVPAGASHVKLYLSTDNDFVVTDDFYVGEKAVPALAAGATNTPQWDFTMPDLSAAATYPVWLVAVVDSQNEVVESDENNTFKAGSVTVTQLPPDLGVPYVSWQAAEVLEGAATWIKVQVCNSGTGYAGPSHVKGYLSTDNDWVVTDDLYLGEKAVGALAPAACSWIQWDYTMPDLLDPAVPGSTYPVWIVAEVDSANENVETNESNTFKASSSFNVRDVADRPDLLPMAWSAQAASVNEGSAFWVRASVRNAGTGAAVASHVKAWLSIDNDNDVADDHLLGEKAVPALAAGAEYWAQWDFTMPNLANPGAGLPYPVWLVVQADSQNENAETEEGNNLAKTGTKAFDAIDAPAGAPEIRIAPLTLTFNAPAAAAPGLAAAPPPLDLSDASVALGEVVPDEITVRFRPQAAAAVHAQLLALSRGAPAPIIGVAELAAAMALPPYVVSVAPLASGQARMAALAAGDAALAAQVRAGALDATALAVLQRETTADAAESGPLGIFHLRVTAGTDLRAASLEMMRLPDVVYAHPNPLARTTGVPNDPQFPRMWNLTRIGMPAAWDYTNNTLGSVKVAVIDTGVRITHTELTGRTTNPVDVYPGNGDAYGDADPENDDLNGHGTACAGVIGALRDNGSLVTGIAPVAIIPVNASAGTTSIGNYDDGIYWGVDHGAAVISMSFGGHRSAPYQEELDAVAYAQAHGVMLVAAAGNEGGTADDMYPAAIPWCISVAAVDDDDVRVREPKWWWGSNYGTTVDISAPGQGDVGTNTDSILTLWRTSNTAYTNSFNGTSAATPQVAGVCALLKHRVSTLTATQIRDIILRTAQDQVGDPAEDVAGWDQYHGHGLIDAAAAVRDAIGSSLPFTIYNDGTATLSVTSMSLETAGAWISWAPAAPFSIAPGGNRVVSVAVDWGLVPAGTATRRLRVYSNDADETPYPGGVNINTNKIVPCTTFSITPTSANPAYTAGFADVSVTGTAPTGCSGGSFAAVANGAWLHVTPASGTAPATVRVSWDQNPDLPPDRVGTATIARKTFTVSQDGRPVPTCTDFSISPISKTTDYHAGSQVVTLTGIPAGCAGGSWDAAGDVPWVHAAPAHGTGPGTTTVSWDENADLAARSGTATIASKTFTVNQGGNPTPNPRVVTLVNSNGPAGADVVIPIRIAAQGNENAVALSVAYDEALLTNPRWALGADVGGATLIPSGKGAMVSLAPGGALPAGTREILRLTLRIVACSGTGSTPVNLVDTPIARQVVGVDASVLPASWVSGAVTCGCPSYEGNVMPDPIDGDVNLSDWVKVGRFAAHLDAQPCGCTYQRADVAPKATLGGGGDIDLADWVQAGRYAARLDPLVAAGGPAGAACGAGAAEAPSMARAAAPAGAAAQTRTHIVALDLSRLSWNGTSAVPIRLEAVGNENALAFSLAFAPGEMTYVRAELGRHAGGATLIVNDAEAADGRIGLLVALPPGATFEAGPRDVVLVSFSVVPGATVAWPRLAFGDAPVSRGTVDVNGASLPTFFGGGIGMW